jgi:hypothetical protein
VTRLPSLAEEAENLLLGHTVRYAFATSELRFGYPDIIREFDPVEQSLVLRDIKNNGGSAPMLGQDQRAPGLLHLANDLAVLARNSDNE